MAEETVLESDKRLSESLLWKLQQEAYTQFGVEAWGNKGVPFYITSNPYTAKQYAHVVLGYLRDCLAAKTLVPEEKIYIVDLGAGTGRFAYLFLRQLLGFLKQLQLEKISLCYVLTDIVSSNLEFWHRHPQLQPFFEEGVLDFAIYHHQQETPLYLIRSQKKLIPKNPLILIANYFFDTIPQDLFRVINGNLEEGRVTLAVEAKGGHYELAPSVINQLKVSYTYLPIPSSNPYKESPYPVQEVLEKYRQQFEGTTFLFPIGAFQSLETFTKLSKGRLLLLAGDQGVCTASQIRNWGEPKPSLHGTFSISVSYHALALYFDLLKGKGLLTPFSDPSFVVMAGFLGKEGSLGETEAAFREYLATFEPVDYWKLCTYMEETGTFEEILLMLQMGEGDPMNFHAFFPKIYRLLPFASLAQKKQLKEVIEKAYENFYPILPIESDFLMNLGVLLFEMQAYEEALAYFEKAKELGGDASETLAKNIAVCRRKLSYAL